MRFITKRKQLLKGVAAFTTLNLLVEIFLPTIAFGLTSGPNQPEFTGFSAVNTSELVDPFSGDFNYSINLMTVPGFESGIPLTLNYQAGVTMEQEASWVGLGWNLNTGAINRQVRGLPDDFGGQEKITRTKHIKPNTTYVVSAKWKKISEILGTDKEKTAVFNKPEFSGKLYYNNYTGLGFGAGMTLSNAQDENGSTESFSQSLNFSIDSQQGASAGAGLAFGQSEDDAWGGGLNLDMSSRNGVENIGFAIERKKWGRKVKGENAMGGGYHSVGSASRAGLSYAMTSMIPATTFPMRTLSFSAAVEVGLAGATVTTSLKPMVTFVQTRIKDNTINYPALGYLYSERNTGDLEGKSMMDYNRENNSAVTTTSKVIPVTVATHDVFSVSAPGFSDQMRLERGDHGMYNEPEVISKNKSFGAGADLDPGVPAEIKFGVNGQTTIGKRYSGRMVEGSAYRLNENFGFKTPQASTSNGFYRKATMVSAGELTANHDPNPDFMSLESNVPLRSEIEKKGLKLNVKPNLKYDKHKTSFSNYPITSGRKKHTTTYQYFTHKENFNQHDNPVTTVSQTNVSDQIEAIVATTPGGKRFEYAQPLYNHTKKEIVMSVDHDPLNEGYGLGPHTNYDKTKESVAGENKSGTDNLFDETVTPAHAYSYLLTTIKSLDYVDVENDGVSEDDFGQYVKYSYTENRSSPYKWRVPFASDVANFSMGHLSTSGDDKASITYGTKDIKYTNRIETKTHVAIFNLENRDDGLSVKGVDGGINTTAERLKRISSIDLCVKGPDYATHGTDFKVVKTAHFEYSYKLCPNIPNFLNSDPNYDLAEDGNGKLTLKRVYFTYRENANSNSKSSPYIFNYNENDGAQNPGYNVSNVNNWGDYQPVRFDYGTVNPSNNVVSMLPYVNQVVNSNLTKEVHDTWSGVWNLKSIHLPSGGEIEVDYEQDEYGHVQDKDAMVMAKIVGFSKTFNGDYTGNITKGRQFIIVDIPGSNLSGTEVNESLSGFKNMYFKALVRLKRLPEYNNTPKQYESTPGVPHPSPQGGRDVYDYVDGYCKTTGMRGIYTGANGPASGFTRGFIEIENTFLSEGYGTQTHPIRKAGLQFLRFQEPLLLSKAFPMPTAQSPASLVKPATFVLNTLLDFVGIITGYYNMAAARGYAHRVDVNNPDFPSFVRVKAPKGTKFGGGHRVKSITMNDNWSSMSEGVSSSYTQEFIYKNYDGTSSGVTPFEPGVFGEENPLREPIYYGVNKILSRDKSMFVEEPLGSSFFPAPSVGYSQVIIKNQSIDNVNLGASGIKVKQFHTAKDFPVFTNRTDLGTAHYRPIPIMIPFIGTIKTTNLGFSQGVVVETNDMHGKPLSDLVLPYRVLNKSDESSSTEADVTAFLKSLKDLEGQETSKINYEYFIRGGGDFTPESRNYVESGINVLEVTRDLNVDNEVVYTPEMKTKELGKTVEFYGSTHENKSSAISGGLNYNHHQIYVLPLPALWPNLSETYNCYRDVSFTKVIKRKGILKKTSAFDGDAVAETENILFDGETGEVLLSTVNNEFGEKVYSYNFKGHQEGYQQMNGAYSNVDLIVKINAQSSLLDYVNDEGISIIEPGDIFVPITSSGELNFAGTLWHESNGSFKDINDALVSTIPDDDYRVFKSGNKNLQNLSVGNLVSLGNPFGGEFPLRLIDLNRFDVQSGSLAADLTGTIKFSPSVNTPNMDGILFYGCDNKEYSVYHLNMVYTSSGNGITTTLMFKLNDGSSLMDIIFENQFIPIGFHNLAHQIIPNLLDPNKIQISYLGNVYNGTYESTLEPCLGGVLHAETTTFSDEHDFYTGGWINTDQNENPHRYGEKLYRPYQTHIYRTDRKPLAISGTVDETNIREDGTYDVFTKYVHPGIDNSAANKNWYAKATATKYSPLSGEIESKDPLDIPSSALFGYNGILPIAVSQNCEYEELVFDGFEEYQTIPSDDIFYGHLGTLETQERATISSEESHTGKNSLKISSNGKAAFYLESEGAKLITGNKYIASVWVKETVQGSFHPKMRRFTSPTSSTVTAEYDDAKSNIEGWQLLELEFTASSDIDCIKLYGGGTFYADDLRVFPSDGAMKSYVYNRDYLTLAAELDERNFATFYNYDEAGNLVQIKKETERGIMTIQTQRKSNYHQ